MQLRNKVAKLAIIDSIPVSAIGSIVLWRIMLDVVYPLFISQKWSYSGLTAEFDSTRYAFILVIQLISLPFAANMVARRSLSDIGTLLLYLISFMPGLTVIAFIPLSPEFISSFCVFWTILFVANALMPFLGFRRNFQINTHLVIGAASVFCSLLVLYVWARYTGFRINMDLRIVYELREEAYEYNMGTLMTYGFAACRALVPVMLGYSLANRRRLLAAWLICLTVIIFSVDGIKTALYSSGIVILMYFLFRRGGSPSKFIYGVVVLGTVGILLSLLGNDFVFDSLLRRIMYLPNYLATQYFEFFSVNEPDYFRQSFLRNFGFVSPYSTSIAVIIGELHYVGGNANSGLLADAFTNFGMAGPIILPLMVVALFRLLQACAEGLPVFLSYSCIFLVIWHLVNSFIFTVLLTHGTLAMCLLTYFLPRKRPLQQELFERFTDNSQIRMRDAAPPAS